MHIACVLAGEMPHVETSEMAANSVLAGEMPHVETSEMAANSVIESLPSLDEPHPPNYILSILQGIDLEAKSSAVRCNGEESRYSCQSGRLPSSRCFGPKMVSETISEHLNSKNFLGSMLPPLPCFHMQ